MKVAVLGAGVIGAGWAARLAENGYDVAVHDPDPNARRKLDAVLENADRAYVALSDVPRGMRGAVDLCPTVADAVNEAELVIEAVPERLDIKQQVYSAIEAATSTAIIASSTSGILPSDLQSAMDRPERLLVAHPFNPVYLLPLVELVPGAQTAPGTVDWMEQFIAGLGMYPLRVRKEIPAFIADRFLEAVWREALWLVKDGVATTAEIDEAIRMGFGLRWAQMGLFETYRVAGGEAGMRHFMAQFGPCLEWPWTRLTDVPEFTDDLVDLIVEQSDAQSGHHDIRALERMRDDNLVRILRGLKAGGWGAGGVLADHEAKRVPDLTERDDLPVTLHRQVPLDWTDYNGHMNEARYLDAFCAATDRLMELVGADAAYVAAGQSYFTAETHIRHLLEARMGDEIMVSTQVLSGRGKTMHLFHRMWCGEALIATGEHMLIHVDLGTRRASPPADEVAASLAVFASSHARHGTPEGAGAAIGVRR